MMEALAFVLLPALHEGPGLGFPSNNMLLLNILVMLMIWGPES